jgi:N-acetylglucosamine-6-phosphate deacetylase
VRETQKEMTRTVEGVHFATGERISVLVRDGHIAGTRSIQGTGEELPLMAPGLVDLQINGYGGIDFNGPYLDESLVVQAVRLLLEEGVTAFYPTIITNSDEAIERALRAVVRAGEQNELVRQTVAGVHLEGPFISPEDGPRGAHGREFVKAPDWELFRRWQEAAGGRIRILTLSPEWPGAERFISRCVESGVVVAIGHTAATPEQVQEAVAAGASMSTHLGNGSHTMLPRHSNYLWEQLAEDRLWASVIPDGFHLPESVLKVFFQAKGERAFLVSDSVSFAGMKPGEYEAHIGEKVILTPEGKLHLAGNPALLAGSAQTLRQGIGHLVKSGLCDLPRAWEKASLLPSSFMGLPQARGLSVGAPADLILFRYAGKGVEVLETYKGGRRVFEKAGVECMSRGERSRSGE